MHGGSIKTMQSNHSHYTDNNNVFQIIHGGSIKTMQSNQSYYTDNENVFHSLYMLEVLTICRATNHIIQIIRMYSIVYTWWKY